MWSVAWLWGCAGASGTLRPMDGGVGTDTGTAPLPTVRVNEFLAQNLTGWVDDAGGHPDWIELYNPDPDPLELGGFTITDDLAEPDQHALDAALEVPATGYLLLLADGLPALGPEHLSFALAREGGEIGLYAGGVGLDRLRYGEQVADWSEARIPDGADAWEVTLVPTPGAANGAE